MLAVLDDYSILSLRLVSKHLSKIASDNELWRLLCLEYSHSEVARRRREFFLEAPVPIEDPAVIRLRAAAQSTSRNDEDLGQSSTVNHNTSTVWSKKGYDSPEENPFWTRSKQVSWYGEYIARHAPVSLSWLQPPLGEDRLRGRHWGEARGLGCFGDFGERIIAPIDDGSVCLWGIGRDINASNEHHGRIMARSKAGLLSANGPQRASLPQPASDNHKTTSNGVVECVSVDTERNKAYFAVQHGLNEVDLKTLQLTSHHRYPAPISVLSKVAYPTPLTVGTTLSLHLHDPRSPGDTSSFETSERLDSFAVIPSSGPNLGYDFHRLLSGDQPMLSDLMNHPCPLSILHPPSSNVVHVAGRFPSILTYDRRTFPKIESTIHSSASLCSLAFSPSHDVNDLVACGEYKSKGSLEIYRIPHSLESQAPVSNIINRTSASSSKLLSVATHGTRLVFSDGDGMLKWVEKDGRTLVRRWNINQFSGRASPRGVFGGVGDGDEDVARKILPLHEESRSELAIWTGEKIGIVGFGKKQRFSPWQEEDQGDEGKEQREMEGLYREEMRRALERQADEVQFTRYLGLGI